MSEKRRINRRALSAEYTCDIVIGDKKQRVSISDVGTGGMKMVVSRYLPPETEIFCKVDIYPGMNPFYVQGRVVRSVKRGEKWEIGVKFGTVRIHNFFELKKISEF